MIRNRVLFLSFLLVVAILWASIATALLFRHSFPVQNFGETSDKPSAELSFLKKFIEQYFTYDSDNFRQTQTALTTVMEEKLRNRRLSEISLLHDRNLQKRFFQTVEVHSIRAIASMKFESKVKVTSFEDRHKSDIFVTVSIELVDHAPSNENPWGYKVQQLTVKSVAIPDEKATVSNVLSLKANSIITLLFPCAVENAKAPPHWKYRIMTTQTSEVQLSTETNPDDSEVVSFSCADRSFIFTVAADGDYPQDLLLAIPLSSSISRVGKKSSSESVPSEVKQTIEHELNFIISE